MLRNEIDRAYCESLAKETEKEKSNEKYKQSKSEQIFNNRENATPGTNGKRKPRLIPAPDLLEDHVVVSGPAKWRVTVGRWWGVTVYTSDLES